MFCRGYGVVVESGTEDPVLFIEQERWDESCRGPVPGGNNEHLGVLVGTADGNDHTAGYMFNWYLGSAGGNYVGSESRVSNLEGDMTYVFEVVDAVSGCSSRQSKYLEKCFVVCRIMLWIV